MKLRDFTSNPESPLLSLPRIQDLADVNGTLFFVASDSAHGREFWRSDRTATLT